MSSSADTGATVRVDEVHVYESGRPDSPAVVFVHGGGPGGRMWGAHLERLSDQFHCLAPDLPGFGHSNHLAPLSLNQTSDLLADLIQRRLPDRRAHIVGLSYGGAVVIALLGRHPELVHRAVVDGAAVLPVWGGWGDRLVQAGIIAVSPLINTRLVGAALSRVGLHELGAEMRSTSPRAFRRAWIEGYTAPLSGAELAAPCPTLFVAGEKETTVRASNAALAALMPDAIAAMVPGLGHAWFGWRRELHVQMVKAWLSGELLPAELIPEPPSPAAVDRVLRLLNRQKRNAHDRPGWHTR